MLAGATLLLIALLLTACDNEPNAPTEADRPSPAIISGGGYRVSVLPLDEAAAINASGAVVGIVANRGVYYSQGVTTDLPLLSTVTRVEPVDLADDGKVLAQGLGPGTGGRAFFYFTPSSSPIDIGPAGPAGWAQPEAMNNQGVAVGRYGPRGLGWGAFRWTGTTGFVDITPPGYDYGWVKDISGDGYAIGWIQLGNPVYQARWNPSGSSVTILSGFTMLQALDNGNVMGRNTSIGSLLLTPSGLVPLGPDPHRLAVDKVGPRGRLVGTYTDATTGQWRTWTSHNSGPTYLPMPAGFLWVRTIDVNACGAILGRGKDVYQMKRVVLWTKLSCDIGPIQGY